MILEQTADAIIYSNRQGMIERWNAAAAAMFGYTTPEVLGQRLDLIIPEHLRAHWRGFEAAMANGTTRLHGRPTLTRALHKSGSKLYVEMSFALVTDVAGTVLGSVAMVRDVTERMERERVLTKGAPGKP
ncbi:MAG: PAS domain S-box protein [Dechloromonas sp.]|nr:MAG: PAS domain S-box protein [Dechloromonas sp.]